jgi:hypothetical protein
MSAFVISTLLAPAQVEAQPFDLATDNGLAG